MCRSKTHCNGCMNVAWDLGKGGSRSTVAMCVETCGLATSCCKTHCNGRMTVAWGLFWGGSRSRKPCVFPYKVASGGDERYLACVCVCSGCGSVVPGANRFSLAVLQRVVVHVCCVRSQRAFWNLCLQFAM